MKVSDINLLQNIRIDKDDYWCNFKSSMDREQVIDGRLYYSMLASSVGGDLMWYQSNQR